MKLTPASTAACRAAMEAASSTGPQVPPMAQAPKLTVETVRLVRPSCRYSMRLDRPEGGLDLDSTPARLQSNTTAVFRVLIDPPAAIVRRSTGDGPAAPCRRRGPSAREAPPVLPAARPGRTRNSGPDSARTA